MDTLIQLKELRLKIEEVFPFTDRSVIDDCINLIEIDLYKKLLQKDILVKEDFDLILDLIQKQIDVLFSNDFHNLLTQMVCSAREQSKGACPLYKVLVSNKLYQYIMQTSAFKIGDTEEEVLQPKRVCFLGINILPTEFVENNYCVIGLRKPKFKYVDIKDVLILGNIQPN